MITCKARNCNSVLNQDSNVTFHKFPLFDSNLLKMWLDNIAPVNYQPKPEDYICSLHFADDQFMKTEPRRLIRSAVPNANSVNQLKAADQNKRQTAKRKAIVIQEEESSDSDADASTSDFSSSSDDNSDSKHNTTNRKIVLEKRKFRYLGDVKEDDFDSPEKLKAIWNIASKEITQQRNKLYSITQRNKRLEGQVTRLKNVIQHLKCVHK